VVSPESAAGAARALGIRIYAVGAGKAGLVRVPVPDQSGGTRYVTQESEIDEASLARIAETTGGRYFRAADLAALGEVYDRIDGMETTRVQVRSYTRFDERFVPFAVLALLLLALEELLALARFGRLP
jgi:Ca-activated chloride channel family protein